MAPGKIKRPDNEYKRCETANVFCAIEPKAGKHFTLATPNRSAAQFVQALEIIIASYPTADTIHMIMDNLNIHGPKPLTDYSGKDKGAELWSRLTVHYTPKHGSWLNQAEIEISLFARQCSPGEESRPSPSCSGISRLEQQGKPRLHQNQLAVHTQEGSS